MSWFKRKPATEIPPVVDEAPPPSSRYHSSSSTYVASRDGDSYSSRSGDEPSRNRYGDNDQYAPSRNNSGRYGDDAGGYGGGDKYSRNNSVGDPYARGNTDARVEDDRNELFSGYKGQQGSTRFYDGPAASREPPPGEENDEDIEGIKKQTRWVKQESATSTRNALRLAREAEETARNTLGRLGDQSEKLANTEMHLDVSKGHAARANDMTDELKKLNRSIFRPAITFNKDAKRAAQAAQVQARYDEERTERERAMMDVRSTQNRLGRAQTYGREGDEGDGEELIGGRGGSGRGRFKTEQELATRKSQRSRYQFEANASDDEIEDEIDDNLDEVSNITKSLKAMGMAMGQELDAQNKRLDVISGKTDGVDGRLAAVTSRQKRIS